MHQPDHRDEHRHPGRVEQRGDALAADEGLQLPQLAQRLRHEPGIAALEVNISCPNVESRGQVFANLINLNRALGGGWSLDDPAPDLPAREEAVAANDSDEQTVPSEEVDR